MVNYGYYPMYNELSDEERAALQNVTLDNLDVKYGSDENMKTAWIDDHCICFNVIVNDIKISFWWFDPEHLAAFIYSKEVKSAAEKVIAILKDEEIGYRDNLEN